MLHIDGVSHFCLPFSFFHSLHKFLPVFDLTELQLMLFWQSRYTINKPLSAKALVQPNLRTKVAFLQIGHIIKDQLSAETRLYYLKPVLGWNGREILRSRTSVCTQNWNFWEGKLRKGIFQFWKEIWIFPIYTMTWLKDYGYRSYKNVELVHKMYLLAKLEECYTKYPNCAA